MRSFMPALAFIVFAGLAPAQERIAPEEAQKFARLLSEHAAKVDAPQIKTEADVDRPFGMRKDELGALVVPDKNLSIEDLEKASKDVMQVGQLWVRNLTASVDGNKVAKEKLRMVTISVNGEEHSLPVFFLGARKKGERLELLVYALEKEPLVVLPLEKINNQQEMPIEFEPKPDAGVLQIGILGKLQAKLGMAKQD
jgi:hypothetical protein